MTTNQQDDFDRGLKNRRAVLGDAWVDKSLENANEFTAEFQELITRYAWNDIWGRPGLDHTTRRLLTLGMTMGLARWDEFELHIKAAVRLSQEPGGMSLELVKETLLQGAIYCGVPAANHGFKLLVNVLREEGLLPAPKPLTAAARVSTHHTFSQPQLQAAVQGATAAGTPIVMSHALGLDLHMWDDVAAQLAVDHPVLRYDHRGHGGSAVPTGPYSMDDLVDDAARLLREWGRGPVVWIGLSMGGMVGQGLAIRHPELIKALVLANTSSKYPEAAAAVFAQRIGVVQAGGMAPVADAVMERYFSPAFRKAEPEVVAVARGTVLRSDPAGYAACCAAVGGVAWLDRLNTITCPTLIIAGKLDVGAPVSMSEAMAERIKGSQLVVFDESAHLSVTEEPEKFAQTLQAFLTRVH
jgi:3-oxoadipate enol-lactonase